MAGRIASYPGSAGARRGQSGITMIELLIGLTISSILSVMIFMTWFSLNDSYSFSVRSSESRDFARQGINRVQNEIRDAEAYPSGSSFAYTTVSGWPYLPNEPSVVRARAWSMLLTTTFNEAGNTAYTKVPHLVLFRLYTDGELWRFEDANGDKKIANVDPNTDGLGTSNVAEQTTGEGRQLVLKNLVNGSVNTNVPGWGTMRTPLFLYSYIDDGGATVETPYAYNYSGGDQERTGTMSVRIRVLVDQNPGHSPTYTDLKVTAQMRNMRQY
jgi:type II secretory pathway pseudopilin PulG